MNNRIEDLSNIESADNNLSEINNQLEWVWGEFFQWDQKDQLKAIDYTQYNRKNKAEAIFDTRVNNNKEIIKDKIDINSQDQAKEIEIENEILTQGLNLNELALKTELEILKQGVTTSVQYIPWLNNVLTEIENQPDVPAETKKTLKEYLAAWDYMWALTEAFDLIGDIFWSLMSITSWTISETYNNILDNLKDIDFANMSKDIIGEQINKITGKINSETDINKKLSITYILSTFKKQFALKDNSKLNEHELLAKNITKWTVLLLNKKTSIMDWWLNIDNIKGKFGSSWLENYNDSLDVSFTHSVIVSNVDPIKITHSTMKKFWEEWSWVQEIPLTEYLNSYPSVNILALDMPNENKTKALNYTKDKLDKQTDYDDWVALSDQSWWYIWSDDTTKVNCVELIAEWLWEEKIKNISDPNDFLKSGILKPTYMTTISSSA